jgi:hypothetical protein
MLAGFLRGDGKVTLAGLPAAGPWYQSHVAVPLMVNFYPTVGTNYRQFITSVPDLAKMFKLYPPKTKLQKTEEVAITDIVNSSIGLLTTQTAVASYKVDALRAAFDFTRANKAVQTTLLSEGNSIAQQNGTTAKALFLAVGKDGTSVACFLTSSGCPSSYSPNS